MSSRGAAIVKAGLVVEDVSAAADYLAEVLAEAWPGIEVETCASVADAGVSIARRVPDVALVDLGLPDGSGVDVIRELGRRGPACHCIVTTIYADDQHLFPALRAGARGYLLKDQPKERVIRALQGIVSGEPPLSPVIAQRLLRVFGADQRTSTTDEERLTPRERETLILIAKGLKLPEVAEQLGVTRNTAAGFIKSVYRKLEVSSRAEATLEAARMGLVGTQF